MNLPSDVLNEIAKHDVNSLAQLPLDHESVTWAFAFLMQESLPEMARTLRNLAQEGKLRIGPLQGFVASAAMMEENQVYIFLSNHYPEYNTSEEIMASLVGEIGVLDPFNQSFGDNDVRVQKALKWLKNKRTPQSIQSSVISVAAQMKDKK